MRKFIIAISFSLFIVGSILNWESGRKKFIDGESNPNLNIPALFLLLSIAIPVIYEKNK